MKIKVNLTANKSWKDNRGRVEASFREKKYFSFDEWCVRKRLGESLAGPECKNIIKRARPQGNMADIDANTT